jgi:hypothetical protein
MRIVSNFGTVHMPCPPWWRMCLETGSTHQEAASCCLLGPGSIDCLRDVRSASGTGPT